MSDLSESHFTSIRGLIDGLPDKGLNTLRRALEADGTGSSAIAEVARLAGLEAADRTVRDQVLAPLLPLCEESAKEAFPLSFGPAIPRLLWRAMKTDDPDLARAAAQACCAAADDLFPLSHDELCRVAAEGVRQRSSPDYRAVAEAADAGQPNGARELAGCLDLVPTTRRAIARLKDWLGRSTNERVASARLLLRDAAGVADDASPRMMTMLQAHLPHRWQILRIISMVMDRPSDSYVAVSELASFGERLLDKVDEQLALIARFRPEEGAEAALACATAVEAAASILAEFNGAFRMSKDGPWGARLLQQKRVLASAAESRLKMVEDAVAAALPVKSNFRRSVRGRPSLRHDPEPLRVACAGSLVSLLHHSRIAAPLAGFEALRAKVTEDVQERIDQYVEDLLEKLHAEPNAEDAPRVKLYLHAAAELAALLTEQKAGDIVLRRMAAA